MGTRPSRIPSRKIVVKPFTIEDAYIALRKYERLQDLYHTLTVSQRRICLGKHKTLSSVRVDDLDMLLEEFELMSNSNQIRKLDI